MSWATLPAATVINRISNFWSPSPPPPPRLPTSEGKAPGRKLWNKKAEWKFPASWYPCGKDLTFHPRWACATRRGRWKIRERGPWLRGQNTGCGKQKVWWKTRALVEKAGSIWTWYPSGILQFWKLYVLRKIFEVMWSLYEIIHIWTAVVDELNWRMIIAVNFPI